MPRITIKVNGGKHSVEATPDTPLLYVLRNEVGLHGPRFGCGLAQCGACTVIMDVNAVRSCVTSVNLARNHKLTTLEGLGTEQKPGVLQAAFIEEQAAQCGFCMNGMIMNAKVFLDKNPNPNEDDIKKALDPILCRCGSHLRVIRAIKRAATMAKA